MSAGPCYHTVQEEKHGGETSPKPFLLSLNFIIRKAGIAVCVRHKQGAQKSDTNSKGHKEATAGD